MDFKKIEKIFLVAFFCLNIFLFITYKQGAAETTTVQESNNFENIEKRLKAEKINYPHDFSTKQEMGYYLSGVPTTFFNEQNQLRKNQRFQIEDHLLSSTFQVPLTVNSEKKQPIRELTKLVQHSGYFVFGTDYQYNGYVAKSNEQAIFSQVFENIPFNDESAELILDIEKGEKNQWHVKGYEQAHLNDVEILREKQRLISERDAIITLYMSSKIPSESKIVKTKLAYTSIFTVQNKNVYIPAWFVWIENNKNNIQVERVNGFSNSVITSTVPSVKSSDDGV